MPRRLKATQALHFRIPKPLHVRLQAMADAECSYVSTVARRMLSKAMDAADAESKAAPRKA